jgi:hypothetical protein
MSRSHYLDIAGRRYTLREAAKAYSLQYATVMGRYRKGDRGIDAVRPLDKGGKKTNGTNTDLAQMDADRDLKRDRQRRAHEAKRAKTDARALKLRQIREQLAAELAKPLAGLTLPPPAEREKIRQGVIGRQRWWGLDSAAGR